MWLFLLHCSTLLFTCKWTLNGKTSQCHFIPRWIFTLLDIFFSRMWEISTLARLDCCCVAWMSFRYHRATTSQAEATEKKQNKPTPIFTEEAGTQYSLCSHKREDLRRTAVSETRWELRWVFRSIAYCSIGWHYPFLLWVNRNKRNVALRDVFICWEHCETRLTLTWCSTQFAVCRSSCHIQIHPSVWPAIIDFGIIGVSWFEYHCILNIML